MIIDTDEHGEYVVRFKLEAENRVVALKRNEFGTSCSSYPSYYVGTAMISFGPATASDDEIVTYLIEQTKAGQEIARLKSILHLCQMSNEALKLKLEQVQSVSAKRLKRLQAHRATIVEYERIAKGEDNE